MVDTLLRYITYYDIIQIMIYFIPAMGDTGHEEVYKKITPEYEVLYLQVEGDKEFSTLVEEARDKITSEDTVLGFSMGALIAYCASSTVPVKKLILASVSPYLEKDYLMIRDLNIEEFDKVFKMTFIQSIENRKYEDSIALNTYFLVGENDHPLAVQRAEGLATQNKATFIKVKDTGHELSDEYIKQIQNILGS